MFHRGEQSQQLICADADQLILFNHKYPSQTADSGMSEKTCRPAVKTC